MIPQSNYNQDDKDRVGHPWFVERGCPMPRPRSLSLGALQNRYVAWNELTQVSTTRPPPAAVSPLARNYSGPVSPSFGQSRNHCRPNRFLIAFVVIVLLAVASFVASFRLISRQVNQQANNQEVSRAPVPMQNVPGGSSQQLNIKPGESHYLPHPAMPPNPPQNIPPFQNQVPGQPVYYQQKFVWSEHLKSYVPEQPHPHMAQQPYYYVPEQHYRLVPEQQPPRIDQIPYSFVPESLHRMDPGAPPPRPFIMEHAQPDPRTQKQTKGPQPGSSGTEFQKAQPVNKTTSTNTKNHKGEQNLPTSTENPRAARRRKAKAEKDAKTAEPEPEKETEKWDNFNWNSNSSKVSNESEKVTFLVVEPAIHPHKELFVKEGTVYIVSHEDQEEVMLETVVEE